MKWIIRDRKVRDGQPTIRGTRVTVADILEQVAKGADLQELSRTFPRLKEGDLEAALEYAAAELSGQGQSGPRLSVVVVVYDMAAQALRTLKSLSPEHQRDVEASDYEIVVVENASDQPLGEDALAGFDCATQYFYREETSASPVGALNFGAAQARAPNLALMVDGARLVTPGIVATALDALRLDPRALLAVPGYHLGDGLQQRAVEGGHDEGVEADLLRSIGWPADGYQLFDVASFSGSCRGGFFRPMAESNFLALARDFFDDLGGYDDAFDLPGGGFCNLDLFTRAVEHKDAKVFVTPGEGTFHQFHGGVTTGGLRDDARERSMKAASAQYRALRARPWKLSTYEPRYLGRVPKSAHRFIEASLGAPAARDAGGGHPGAVEAATRR